MQAIVGTSTWEVREESQRKLLNHQLLLRDSHLSVVNSSVLGQKILHGGSRILSSLIFVLLPAIASAQMGGGGGGMGGSMGGGMGGGMGGQPSAPPPASGGGGGGDDAEDYTAELRHEDPTIRLFAVKALSQSKDEKAVEYLVEACSDEDNRVRLKAIDSLGTMRATGATSSLVQMLYLRESEPWLKQRVLVALGKIGDSRASRPISDLTSRESDRRTIGTAVFALGAIGDPNSIPRLEKISETTEDPDIKRLANDAVAKIKKRQINPEIVIEALRPDPNQPQRPASASVGNPLAY